MDFLKEILEYKHFFLRKMLLPTLLKLIKQASVIYLNLSDGTLKQISSKIVIGNIFLMDAFFITFISYYKIILIMY